jgi:hypothetical protein
MIELLDELRMTLGELWQSEIAAAAMLILGVGLLFGNGAQIASAVHQELMISMARLDSVRCGDLQIDVQSKNLWDLSGVQVHWTTKPNRYACCERSGPSVTVTFPERGYRFSTPVIRQAIQPSHRTKACNMQPKGLV